MKKIITAFFTLLWLGFTANAQTTLVADPTYGENNSDFNIMELSYMRTATEGGGEAPNNPPVAVDDDSFEITEDAGPTGIDYSTLLANDSDPDGDALSVVGFNFFGFPGEITNDPDREQILFTTDQDFNGEINIGYVVSDGQATTLGLITITITPVLDEPVVRIDGPFATSANTPLTISIADLLANDSDPDEGDVITFNAIESTQNGSATVSNGTITFTPAPDFVGQASFIYSIVSTTTLGNSQFTDVVTSEPIIVNVESTPTSISGSFVLRPKANADLTLQVNDTDNRTSAVVEVCDAGQVWTITEQNDGYYEIVNDLANKALESWRPSPSNGNDVTIYDDNNRDWQRWELVAAGDGYYKIKGKYNPRFITLDDGNAIVADENGSDNQLWELVAPASVDCNNEATTNTAPVAADDQPFGNIIAGREFTFSPDALLDNDTDPDGDPISVVAVGDFQNVQVALTSPTVFTLTSDSSYSGPAQFSYTISDGNGGTDQATVKVTITNRSPIARNDSGFEAVVGTPLFIPFSAVLANDNDPDGDLLTVFEVTDPQNGTVALVGQEIRFTPTAVGAGSGTFAYTITDGTGRFATGIVAIDITEATGSPNLDPVTLSASTLSESGSTEQSWGECATVSAQDGQGNLVGLGKRNGRVGVATGRYGFQLNYDAASATTERILIDFNRAVSAVTIKIGNLEKAEYQGLNETGYWIGYSATGAVVAQGVIDPALGNQEGQGIYRFDLGTVSLHTVELGATAYGQGQGTARVDNNSDFSLISVGFTPASACGISVQQATQVGAKTKAAPEAPLIRAYPNPVVDQLQVTAPASDTQWFIYSATGTLVRTLATPANGMTTLEVGDLKSGAYLLRAVSAQETQQLRFIKK